MAAPEWDVIDRMPEEKQKIYTVLRTAYSSALINGPFSILVGSKHGLLALNDRLKLRSLITEEKGNKTYFASEESAIRIICPDPEKIAAVDGNDPLFKVKNGENALAFYSHYYQPLPLVLRGYGAGNDVTAAGVFADLLRTLSWKLGV